LIEISQALEAEQRAALKAESVPVAWHSDLGALKASGPGIIIANEFLDALPLAQWVSRGGTWHQRSIGLDASGALAFVEGPTSLEAALQIGLPAPPQDGIIFESRARAVAVLAEKLASLGARCAGLFIDYGHVGPAFGETLQGLRAHRYDDPLAAPGECDLTAQVDFSAFATAAIDYGLACDGPVTQAEFLGRLGIAERASRLMAANPDRAGAIEASVARLMAPNGMGTRFKVTGVRDPSLPPLPGLEPVDSGSARA
jgi:SAM-dependent MidA family methyltransferase